MEIIKRNQTIKVESINHDSIQQITDGMDNGIMTLSLMSEFLSSQVITDQKKKSILDLVKAFEDKGTGLDLFKTSLTAFKDYLENIQMILETIEKKKISKRSQIAKKLVEMTQNEEKKKELQNEIVESNYLEIEEFSEEYIIQLEEWTEKKCDSVVLIQTKMIGLWDHHNSITL